MNSPCDCCEKVWKVEMTQDGRKLRLCIKHSEELLRERVKDKRGEAAAKWANNVIQR